MPIIRGEHAFDNQFTQIPNDWLRDNRLSLKAIGLLAQLLSHSPGWSISVAQLARHNDCGLDLIRNAVKELEACGYLERSQRRIANKFGEAVWRTADPSPSSGFPSSGFPSPGNPTPKNNNVKKNNEKKDNDDFSKLFAEFWDSYPRKVGKAAAERAFAKCDVKFLAIAGARRLANDPNLPEMQFIPHPTTWLNRAGWEDDPLPPREPSKDDLAAKRAEAAARERELSKRFLEEQAALAAQAVEPPRCLHGKNPALCTNCFRQVENSANVQ